MSVFWFNEHVTHYTDIHMTLILLSPPSPPPPPPTPSYSKINWAWVAQTTKLWILPTVSSCFKRFVRWWWSCSTPHSVFTLLTTTTPIFYFAIPTSQQGNMLLLGGGAPAAAWARRKLQNTGLKLAPPPHLTRGLSQYVHILFLCVRKQSSNAELVTFLFWCSCGRASW